MIVWSQIAEFLALILLFLISLYFHDRRQTRSRRRTLFWICLVLSIFEIALNAVCVITISQYEHVPHWLNMLLNSLYFLSSVWVSSILALYIFNLLLEHVYEKHCRTNAVIGLLLLNALFFILVIVNLQTGILFLFDSDGGYHRGVFNRAGYVVMFIELCMVIICYLRNRSSVSKNVQQVIHTLPPIILGLALFQICYPQILLNGITIAFADLVLFINFQNYQVGTDSLTHIGNRKSFYQELALRIAGKQQFQIITISLKHFAVVNQRFGYQKGDDFLYAIASWLDKCDPSSRAFRFGNVSFALVSPFLSQDKAACNLDKIQMRFQDGWTLGDLHFDIAEALLRLSDYSGTPISPGEFIPLAEETGLIDEMSWIVLEKVCRLLGENPALEVESISINLSMQQFLDLHICQRITACLQRYQVPPDKLKIEITERVIAYDLPYIRSVMDRIAQVGIGFYLDDFGIGYSNFSSIMHLPFECVKLDRSLFDKLLVSKKDRTIVQTMIELAHSVGFQVVSEGIETQQQADLLMVLGTDRIQGYHYARPMAEKEFLAFHH